MLKDTEIKNIIKLIIVISIPINFVWEMIQMPFYIDMGWDLFSSLFCLVASFVDAIMILVIYLGTALAFKDLKWIRVLSKRQIGFTLFIGFIIALIVELVSIELGLWNYSDKMIDYTIFGAGISPILQMLILPLIVFKISKNKLFGRR